MRPPFFCGQEQICRVCFSGKELNGMGKPLGAKEKGFEGKWKLTAVIFLALGLGCAALQGGEDEPWGRKACGVEIRGVRVTAGGGFVDLRFRVLEPQKASSLLDPSVPASLVHEPTGRVLTVASSKIGKLKQRTAQPEPGKEYFILFRNSGGLVNPGDRVSLAAGSCKVEGLEVQ